MRRQWCALDRRFRAAAVSSVLIAWVVAADDGAQAWASQDAAIKALGATEFDPASLEGSAVEDLVHRGWHDAVQALVARSHTGTEELKQRVAAQVREAVRGERNRLDDLVRALDQNYGKAVEVSPAMQWAQNSTHAFVTVKFAQRWNAPGALEVENETVDISKCCFNFTAYGEHSFIRRRYHLSFELFRGLLPAASSWARAAAGRLTVILAKATTANWPRLVARSADVPKNLGIWRDMQEKWRAEVDRLTPLPASEGKGAPASKAKVGKGTKKEKADDARLADDVVDEDALDKELDMISECPKSSYIGTSVGELCESAWPQAVESPVVRGRRWLVQFYSSGGGNADATRDLMPVWKRLADVFPSMVPLGRVGAVDCEFHKDLCKRLNMDAKNYPEVRRFPGRGGATAGDVLETGADRSLEALADWGAGKQEL